VILLFSLMMIGKVISSAGIVEFCVVNYLVSWSNCSQLRLLLFLSLLAAVVSALINSVTTLVVLVPVTLEICNGLKINWEPFVFAVALMGNIGGTATLIGTPSNIIIGTVLGDVIGFIDFLKFVLPVSMNNQILILL
jgi:Na+/H+ antiporter NhaD/arsenite permease-like protein